MIDETICEGEGYTLGNNTFFFTGTYEQFFPVGNGCDSIVTLNLTVTPRIHTNPQISLCEG